MRLRGGRSRAIRVDKAPGSPHRARWNELEAKFLDCARQPAHRRIEREAGFLGAPTSSIRDIASSSSCYDKARSGARLMAAHHDNRGDSMRSRPTARRRAVDGSNLCAAQNYLHARYGSSSLSSGGTTDLSDGDRTKSVGDVRAVGRRRQSRRGGRRHRNHDRRAGACGRLHVPRHVSGMLIGPLLNRICPTTGSATFPP